MIASSAGVAGPAPNHPHTKKPASLRAFCFAGFVLPAAVAAAAEAEGDAGAAAVIARSAVIAVRTRGVVAVAIVMRPVMTVAPVAMVVVVMSSPMPMTLARTDVGRGLGDTRRGLCLHRIIGSVGDGTSHQRSRADGKKDS